MSSGRSKTPGKFEPAFFFNQVLQLVVCKKNVCKHFVPVHQETLAGPASILSNVNFAAPSGGRLQK